MQKKISRKEQKENTRKSLIKTASKIFEKKGITATSTSEIAKELEISHGTLFLHFPTREDLLIAVLDEFGEKLSNELRIAVQGELTVKKILEAHINALADYEDFYFRILSELHFLPEQVKSTVFIINSCVSYKLHKAAEIKMKEGLYKNFDQIMLFTTWMSLINYYIFNRTFLSDKKSILNEKKSDLINHFLKLIKN